MITSFTGKMRRDRLRIFGYIMRRRGAEMEVVIKVEGER